MQTKVTEVWEMFVESCYQIRLEIIRDHRSEQFHFINSFVQLMNFHNNKKKPVNLIENCQSFDPIIVNLFELYIVLPAF